MQKLEFCDELAFERLDRGIELVCADRAVPVGPENLVWRAAALFFAETRVDFGVRITLSKHIPVAAGLGGGSSDAAATLRALLRLSGLRMPRAQQLALALCLGAGVLKKLVLCGKATGTLVVKKEFQHGAQDEDFK